MLPNFKMSYLKTNYVTMNVPPMENAIHYWEYVPALKVLVELIAQVLNITDQC
jgi:hypothetical protein